MGFRVDSEKKRARPEINVTPLIDVVLVLLIIFMVVTPLMRREFWTHLPKQDKKEVVQKTANNDSLVLRIMPGDKLLVNKAEISVNDLSGKLKRMFAAKDDHVLFVDIDNEANYGFAVQAMDKAREGGAVTIALLAKPINE
ncbi:MAG: biopolymer transporter ExbD [Nitrospirae bacterium]|nr:biopolymer transporter ExbD [Nitrospirota bacterium]